VKIISLDSRRDPHPQRAERLRALPRASRDAGEMQCMMRQAHQDQNFRAAVVSKARE
jgi:hypothetical protein